MLVFYNNFIWNSKLIRCYAIIIETCFFTWHKCYLFCLKYNFFVGERVFAKLFQIKEIKLYSDGIESNA